MKRMMMRTLAASLVALMTSSVVMADIASAQPRDHDRYERRDDRRNDRYERRDDRRDDRYDRRDDRRDYRDDRRDDRRGRYDHPYRYDSRGYYGWRERSSWRRGGYVSYSDWNRGYVVDYHRHHHLYAPPRGYEWRYVDDRYVLAAITTGLIAAIILSN